MNNEEILDELLPFLERVTIFQVVYSMLHFKFQQPFYVNELKRIQLQQLTLWLEKHTNKTDVIQNNYGDAGLWIPSIIFRPITEAHINLIYMDKIKPLGEPKYIYIGKKRVYHCPLKNSAFKNDDKYESVYSNQGVYIYRIIK